MADQTFVENRCINMRLKMIEYFFIRVIFIRIKIRINFFIYLGLKFYFNRWNLDTTAKGSRSKILFKSE
jgi:hypothetical protein